MPVLWAGRMFHLQIPMRRLSPTYEKKAATVWGNLLLDGETVWDVGANLGLYTLLSASIVGPSGKVMAWEPSPVTFVGLNDHIVANGLSDRVQVFQSAIADRRGQTIPFAAIGTSQTNRIASTTEDVIQVPVETLDGVAADSGSRPDAIKIDIEGAEVLALRGAVKLLQPGLSKRPIILIAVHPQFVTEFGCSTDELAVLFAQYEYECYDLDGNPTRPTEYSEYICFPRERSATLLNRLRGIS